MKNRKVNIFLSIVLIAIIAFGIFFRANQTPTVEVVGLLPFEGFKPAYTDSIASIIHKQYGFEVVILETKKLPNNCFVYVKSPRYRADKLLKYLLEIKPDSVDLILGLTHKDISTTKKDQWGKVKEPGSKYGDWGIFGLGYRPGDAAIVSVYRLSKPGLTIRRLQKVSVHEIGHNLGLKHCTQNKHCVMDDAAESIGTIDKGGFDLCEYCHALIDKGH